MNKTTGAATLLAVAGAMLVPTVGIASVPPTSDPATDSAPSGTDAAAAGAVDLSGVCPETIVIQTDWWPEAEYGATYGLIGPEYSVDTNNKTVSGPLYSQGQPTGVNVEIRAGSSAIGDSTVRAEMYTKDEITFGYGSTDSQILNWDTAPLLSVVAPLEINPQIIMWDPDTYPDVETLADLRDEGVVVNVFGGQTFTDILVADGVLDEGQVDPSYDGSPSTFIARDGTIAQQGFASSEPFVYENLPEWGKPVAFQLIHDAGFQNYSQTLAIRADDLETLRPCLEAFVPVVQQSAVDFLADPDATLDLIVDVVEQYDSFWTYPADLAAYSVEAQAEYGLTGNGDDSTIGNFDESRVERLLEQMRSADMDVADDLTAADLVTNEFIDPAIGVPAGDTPAGTEAAGTETAATEAAGTEAPAGSEAAPATTAAG